MILQKDIQYWRDYGGDLIAGIPLKKLEKLRQQLKDKFKTSIYNYDEAEQFINDVLCVEGE